MHIIFAALRAVRRIMRWVVMADCTCDTRSLFDADHAPRCPHPLRSVHTHAERSRAEQPTEEFEAVGEQATNAGVTRANFAAKLTDSAVGPTVFLDGKALARRIRKA